MLSALLCLAFLNPAASQPLPATDWITTGPDCDRFDAGDLNADSVPDLLTINRHRDLCASLTVLGLKASSWAVLAPDLSPDAVAIVAGDLDPSAPGPEVLVVEPARVVLLTNLANNTFTTRTAVPAPAGSTFRAVASQNPIEIACSDGWRTVDIRAGAVMLSPPSPPKLIEPEPPISITPPPYSPDARSTLRFTSPLGPAGGRLAWEVFETTRPSPHRVVRVAVAEGLPGDRDADGLSDAEEALIGSNPADRDTDADGLPDPWEVKGLPRSIPLGDLLAKPRSAERLAQPWGASADNELSPTRQDVICALSYFEGVDPAQFRREMVQVQRVYRDLDIANPDGSTGLFVHFIELPGFVPKADHAMPWWDIGHKYFSKDRWGIMHWMQITPGGGGQSSETGFMGGSGNGWHVFAHEFGHQLSLSHTGDSAPAWCPLYTSMMSYAFSYQFDGDPAKVHFSRGRFAETTLLESALTERLPYPHADLAYLAKWPFRFTLAPDPNNPNATLIDWNQNGAFDEGTIQADINYGSSTHAGTRRTHELIGSAPSLATIGDTAVLAALLHNQSAVTLKTYLGEERWTPPIPVAASASRNDPVLVGGPDFGVLFVRRFNEWAFARVPAPGSPGAAAAPAGDLTPLPSLPLVDLSGIRIGDRLLLVSRRDDHSLERRWLSFGSAPAFAPTLSDPAPLPAASMVPPGLAINLADCTLTMVHSDRGEKSGPFCMRVSTFRIAADDLTLLDQTWTHNGNTNHCTSRPVPVYHHVGGKPQLVIFHTGWADQGGTWSAWRTTRVGNTALDGGWLTSEMYDVWTRSRVAAAFTDSPRGAVYAFRWDPGDHNDWKVNTMFVAHNGFGIDPEPMRDFNDGRKIGLWGIRHSILTMIPDHLLPTPAPTPVPTP